MLRSEVERLLGFAVNFLHEYSNPRHLFRLPNLLFWADIRHRAIATTVRVT